MYAGSSRLGAELSTDEVIDALRRYTARKARWSRVVTVTARRIARELGIGRDPMVLTRVGMVLAELERLGLLEVRRSRRPKKYVVTKLGLVWCSRVRGRGSMRWATESLAGAE